LKIVQISSYYPPHLGGQENAVHDLATQLALAGHQTQVLTSTVGGGPKGVSREDNVEVYRLPGFVFGHAPIMPRFPAALLRVAEPDSVVHLHIGQAFTPEMVWLAAKLRHFKYIAQLHIDFEPSGSVGWLLPFYKQVILRRVIHSAAAVIVLNQQTMQALREKYHYTGKAYIMSNGVDDAYFKLTRPPYPPKPPKTLHLLFVGRLSKQKNVGALLRALKLTKRDVRLDLVGEGEEGESVLRTILDYNLTNVTMHGRLARAEVMELYEKCDALVMPSLYEAQPLVLLEAMAARVPIIGTDVIGVGEHIKDVGIVVDPSPVGIAEGIDQYYRQFTSLPYMVEHGYHKAEESRWLHNLKKYEAIYEEIARA
jgi:glycosyltransferase involved in cell wall biosynthesis